MGLLLLLRLLLLGLGLGLRLGLLRDWLGQLLWLQLRQQGRTTL